MSSTNGARVSHNPPPAPLSQQHSQSSHQNSPIPNGAPANDMSNSSASGGNVGAGQPQQIIQNYGHEIPANNTQQDHQSSQQHMQTQQIPPPHPRYTQRDGPATINLPPGTRIHQQAIMPTDAASAIQQQQDTANAMYNHQMAYQQVANAGNPATGYIQGYAASAPMAAASQFYTTYGPAGQYYTNTGSGYSVTPQALIMQQPHAAQQTAAYQQLLSQNQGYPGPHTNQMITTSAALQHQQQAATQGIAATVISHMQQGNVVTTTGAGNIQSTGTMQASQNIPPPQQPQKQRKILQIVDPSSGEAVKFGSESKPPPSTTSAVVASEEEKSTEIKSEFMKKISERVKEEVGGGSPAQQNNYRSPSSFAGSDSSYPQANELQSTVGVGTIPKSLSGVDLQMMSSFENQVASSPPVSTHVQHVVSSPNSHIPVTTLAASMPIPIEHSPQSIPIIHHHSPHNLPSILEIKVTQPSPQPQLQQPHTHILQHKAKEEQPVALQAPTFGVVISPSMREHEIYVGDVESSEKQRHHSQQSQTERRNHVPDIIEQDVNGSNQSPTLTEGAEEIAVNDPLSEDKIRELEEEMQTYHEKRETTHDTDAMVYNRTFLMFLRKVTQVIKTVKCPKSEEELQELGLSKRGMPVSQLNAGGKTKRFEQGGDMFKPSWQQPGSSTGPQFGSTRFNRPPNYMGRGSDKQNRSKKPMVQRISLDHRPDHRPIKLAQYQQQDAISKKSTNAWKSKREERFDMNATTQKNEDDAKYDKMRKEIRGLLNKITPSTYEELSNDFCAYKIYDDPKLLIPIIDLIFDKAVEEPHFCPLYSDLCKKQVDFERQAKAQRDNTPDGQPQTQQRSFKNEIIFKCQRTFLASEEYDNKVKELEEKLKSEGMDDKSRTHIEEELEIHRSKEKRRLLGIIKFIGQLYRHQLLVETIIDWCACELIKRYDATKEEVYIEYNVELIETVGKIYEQRKEQVLAQIARQAQQRTAAQVASGGDMKPDYRLDMVFSHLITVVKPLVSNRLRFAIMDLEDLRKNNWNPRGGEKGPKTIEEVREEVEKEQQDNELERIEHEKQKEKDKLQPSRKSSGRAYMGRPSADRRQAAAAASSMSRESKAESRITGPSRLSDLDDMPLGRRAWQPNRERTPQNDTASGTGSTPSGGGSTGGSSDPWRSTKSDSPKDG